MLLASEYGARYGYHWITVKLREAGWEVGTDRVQRDLATGGIESAAKTKAPGKVVVE